MKGIITVVGKDKVGIIAKVCTFLSEEGINILDISQTIVQGYFNMMMIVDMSEASSEFVDIVDRISKLGQEIGVDIRLQHQDIFDNMHRI
ncbi:MAG: ACT domain-containing protein [Cellulosilyticum sp.]|nr:ACT domain-containing protein [Cellulosilyticum sp.]